MKRIQVILVCVALTWLGTAAADVELKIITPKGYVAFTVADHWRVLLMETKMPVAAAVFQLPNPADQGTPDSTNLIIQFFERGSEKEKAVYAAPVTQHGSAPPKVSRFKEWKIFRQEALQGKTMYSIWDAKRDGMADVSVSVRLAWPHLPNNPPGYNDEMEKTFRTFLDYVSGGFGKHTPKKGEVIRRLQ